MNKKKSNIVRTTIKVIIGMMVLTAIGRIIAGSIYDTEIEKCT